MTEEELNKIIETRFEKLENKIDTNSRRIVSEIHKHILKSEIEQSKVNAENKRLIIYAITIFNLLWLILNMGW